MRPTTRFKFNAFLTRVAELNNVDASDMNKKFTVEPSVSQTLMTRVQESSDFLTRINIVPVGEMKGEKIGVGVTGSIASTTDTAGGDERETADFAALDAEGYECGQINYDFHIRYNTLDLWARYEDFQARLRDAIIKRQALDRIMVGFNGTSRAKTSNLSIYWQEGTHRRLLDEVAKRDRIENYESINEDYVIEDYAAGCLVENIQLGDFSKPEAPAGE